MSAVAAAAVAVLPARRLRNQGALAAGAAVRIALFAGQVMSAVAAAAVVVLPARRLGDQGALAAAAAVRIALFAGQVTSAVAAATVVLLPTRRLRDQGARRAAAAVSGAECRFVGAGRVMARCAWLARPPGQVISTVAVALCPGAKHIVSVGMWVRRFSQVVAVADTVGKRILKAQTFGILGAQFAACLGRDNILRRPPSIRVPPPRRVAHFHNESRRA